MKKRIFIFSAILIFIFSSCHQKADESTSSQPEPRVKNLVAELSAYCITGTCNLQSPEHFFMPEKLKVLLNRRFFVGNKRNEYTAKPLVFYAAELALQDNAGSFENVAFYDAFSDDASWVETMFVQMEEERIALQIQGMEDAFEEDHSGDEEPEDSAQDALKNQHDVEINDEPSTEIADKNNQLFIAEYDKEKLVHQENADYKILIYAYENVVRRRFYDKKSRLVREENWLIRNADSAEMQKSIAYEYEGDSFRQIKKITDSGSGSEILFYDEKGRAFLRETYFIPSDSADDKKITASVSRTYNEEGLVREEKSIDYVYTDSGYGTLDYAFEKKYVYFYNEGDIPPDFMYYENDVLKMHNKYSVEPGSYTSQIYFDENYNVKTYYVNNVRVREVFTINGEVRRDRFYGEK